MQEAPRCEPSAGPAAAEIYAEPLRRRLRRIACVLRTIDLRGRRRPATAGLRRPGAAGRLRRRGRGRGGPADLRRRRRARGRGAGGVLASGSTASSRESFRVPAAALRGRGRAARPRAAGGVRGVDRPAAARSARPSWGEPRSTSTVAPGAPVTQRMIPVGRVGLYVPGGLAPLASSVIMNVVPAQVAGVALDRRGLAAAARVRRAAAPEHPRALRHLLGVDEVYAVGGAQAIAMFAYGVPGLCRAGRPGHRARATSTSSRPSGCSRAGSTSTPRPVRPRSPCWPTPPPTRCTSPPT